MDKVASFFGGLTGTVELDIRFDIKQNIKYHKIKSNNEKIKLPIYTENQDISGIVNLQLKDTKKFEHLGIKCYLIGYLEIHSSKDLSTQFVSLSKELEPAGILTENKQYKFKFSNFQKPYQTFVGIAGKVKYFIRVIVSKKFSIIKELQFAVLLPDKKIQTQTAIIPMKMQVGIEDCLHIDFQYNKSFYHLRDVIFGKVNFYLVKLNIVKMEIGLVRRQTFGNGANQKSQKQFLIKFEVMDGCPKVDQSIPIRMYLKGIDLTPTYQNIHNRLSVKYWINLIIIDAQDRRYFKQTEVIFYRKP